ncbi:MAG: hypothetical protein M1352_01440 [Patescibacteria group bacterium]|nr:hypothetical protein [Patescibacteria group bacterium]
MNIFGKEALAFAITPSALGLSGFNDLGSVVSAFLPVIISLAGLALFAYLLLGGIKYLTSGGDDKALMEARKIITNAVIGMIIVFISFWIIRIVETVLGISITGF